MSFLKKRKLWLTICIGFILFLFVACNNDEKQHQHKHDDHQNQEKKLDSKKETASPLTFDHIHGLGFTGDGNRLLMAAHDGLRQFINGIGSRPPGPLHDYMGFQVVDDAFYSSGHPAPGDSLPNPLGLVTSKNFGNTVESISLLGKTDLHVFAVGYRSKMMYAYNEYPNDMMPKKALYISSDKGKNWTQAPAKGFYGIPSFLAVHPDQTEVAAMLNEEGELFYTMNRGDTFQRVAESLAATTLFFSLDAKQLLYFPFKGDKMKSITLSDWQVRNEDEFGFGDLDISQINYIAQHPKQLKTFAVTTTNNDVFITEDGGTSWSALAKAGIINP